MPISEDLERSSPVPWSSNKTKVLPVIGSDPTLIYGIELEIEGLGHLNSFEDACVDGMVYHQDGSLRNNGAEYVTKPMQMRELAYILEQFFKKNKLSDKNYSERCSVHVHTNVLDMSWEQLKTLVLVYLVFERNLFSFIGNERDKNIFCVPLYDTMMVNNILKGDNTYKTLSSKLGRWEKYTALNFLPIGSQGSIEWRHMHGTNDVQYILTWCNLIGKIFSYVRKTSWDDAFKFFINLNTSSMYNDAVMQVFGDFSGVLFNTHNFAQNIEEGVLNAKYSLGVEALKSLKTTKPWANVDVEMMNAVAQAGAVPVAAFNWNDIVAQQPQPAPQFMFTNPATEARMRRYEHSIRMTQPNRQFERRLWYTNPGQLAVPPEWQAAYIGSTHMRDAGRDMGGTQASIALFYI